MPDNLRVTTCKRVKFEFVHVMQANFKVRKLKKDVIASKFKFCYYFLL